MRVAKRFVALQLVPKVLYLTIETTGVHYSTQIRGAVKLSLQWLTPRGRGDFPVLGFPPLVG